MGLCLPTKLHTFVNLLPVLVDCVNKRDDIVSTRVSMSAQLGLMD